MNRVALALAFVTVGALGGLVAACGSTPCEGIYCKDGVCKLDAVGPTFTFHVKNAGKRALSLPYGCGKSRPITVDTAKGAQPIAAGNADACEVSCDDVFKGASNVGCSDCGPGSSAPLDAGKTVDVTWDRRVFTKFTADVSCSGHMSNNDCALGNRVDDKAIKTGTLTICTDTTGECPTSSQEEVPFKIDLTKAELTITVM